MYAVDVNERALDLLRTTAASLGLDRVHASQPDGIPEDVRFDAIWSNPPIRVGKAALHDLMLTWLPRLAPGRRGLPRGAEEPRLGLAAALADRAARPEAYAVSRFTSDKGFRILEVERRRY